jgi:hypothetical protein
LIKADKGAAIFQTQYFSIVLARFHYRPYAVFLLFLFVFVNYFEKQNQKILPPQGFPLDRVYLMVYPDTHIANDSCRSKLRRIVVG